VPATSKLVQAPPFPQLRHTELVPEARALREGALRAYPCATTNGLPRRIPFPPGVTYSRQSLGAGGPRAIAGEEGERMAEPSPSPAHQPREVAFSSLVRGEG